MGMGIKKHSRNQKGFGAVCCAGEPPTADPPDGRDDAAPAGFFFFLNLVSPRNFLLSEAKNLTPSYQTIRAKSEKARLFQKKPP
jgi:hypothetical protein